MARSRVSQSFSNPVARRATNIRLRLPDKTFWLPDNINVKKYSKTFGCPVGQPGINFCLSDRKKWLPRATGYVETLARREVLNFEYDRKNWRKKNAFRKNSICDQDSSDNVVEVTPATLPVLILLVHVLLRAQIYFRSRRWQRMHYGLALLNRTCMSDRNLRSMKMAKNAFQASLT